MLVDEFINYLKEQENKNIVLELKGIIETNIEIKQIEVLELNKYLTIKSKNVESGIDEKEKKNNYENKDNRITINLHQLMKITKITGTEFLLKFDQLQEITIKLFSN